MQRKGPHKKSGLILFSAVLMLQLSLLPAALSIIQYSSASSSHKMSCNLQHRRTCDTGGAGFCPMHDEGKAHHSDGQPYFCGCSHSAPDYIAISFFGSEAVLEAAIAVGLQNSPVVYAEELNRLPSDPYLPFSRPPG